MNCRPSVSHLAMATSVTTAQITAAPESPVVKAFVHSAMKRFGMTEQELRERAIRQYGSVEGAMRTIEASDARNKAAMEKAYPNGYDDMIIIGVSVFFELEN